jgi:molybdopterin converting factor small subunit
VRLNAAGGLDLFGNQSSGVLTSAVWADGLVDNPANQAIARGDSGALSCRWTNCSCADEDPQVRYFASLREALGRARNSRCRRPDAGCIARRQLIARGGRHAEVLAAAAPGALRAQPGDGRRSGAAEGDGAEVAFFPPVTGG